MNILYLHGLKSKLKPEKRKILEKYGNVYAPDIDYNKMHVQPEIIMNRFPGLEINVVIGSSMGALNGYIISENIGRPALLFNPPLAKYQEKSFRARFIKLSASKQIILGGRDEVVNPAETMRVLADRLQETNLEIFTDPHLGHRIPVELFREQVKNFFSKLC